MNSGKKSASPIYTVGEVRFVSNTTNVSESSSGIACVILDGPPSPLDVEVSVMISTSINGKAGTPWHGVYNHTDRISLCMHNINYSVSDPSCCTTMTFCYNQL